MADRSSHPLFARVYTRVAELSERRGGGEHRRKLLTGLAGRVVEVGAGSGANFPHYPASVSEVIALEPERYLRQRAQRAAAETPISISVTTGDAEQLPGEVASFDAGVVALVLCTVPDQQKALAELHRVIRPGGELRFYEHVLSHSKWEARVQQLADATFWPHLAGGCHLARDTTTAIEQAGFQIETIERFSYSFAPGLPSDPHVLGIAQRN
jgi:ubiquinone/menaquinone biosynthesis C-methylase UbiE